jgi:mannose-6-phosphate isomerase-like protein (cupin superfamily)
MGAVTKKPWGYYRTLYQGENILTRTVVINPGATTDLQRYTQRTKTWSIVSGSGVAFVGGTERDLSKIVHVPKYSFHRIENTGDRPLVVYEVQAGLIFDEDEVTIKDK